MKEQNKIHGLKKDFAPIMEDASRVIIGYGYVAIDEESGTWYEVVKYKKQTSQLSLSDVKTAIIADIDARTSTLIVGGFTYEGKPVWLSMENQANISAAERRAATTGDNLPLTIKIGEQEDGAPVYHTFDTADALTAFWNQCQDYIQQCREQGWKEKDSIDWMAYKDLFPEVTEGNQNGK